MGIASSLFFSSNDSEKQTLHRRITPSDEQMKEQQDRWNELAEFELTWVLDADFAGVLEAQNGRRQQTGPVQGVSIPQGVKFVYGHPDLPLETHVRPDPGGDWRFAGGRLKTQIRLARQESLCTALTVECVDRIEPYDSTIGREREDRLDPGAGDQQAQGDDHLSRDQPEEHDDVRPSYQTTPRIRRRDSAAIWRPRRATATCGRCTSAT